MQGTTASCMHNNQGKEYGNVHSEYKTFEHGVTNSFLKIDDDIATGFIPPSAVHFFNFWNESKAGEEMFVKYQ